MYARPGCGNKLKITSEILLPEDYRLGELRIFHVRFFTIIHKIQRAVATLMSHPKGPPGEFCQYQNSNDGARVKPGRVDGAESKTSRSEMPDSMRR